jgi:hypothetical protein
MISSSKTKLALNRETLQRLDANALDAVRGGAGNGNGQGNTNTNDNNNTGNGQGNRTSCWFGNCCNGR